MGDGVFDADEAEAERVKAKAKLEKVRPSIAMALLSIATLYLSRLLSR